MGPEHKVVWFESFEHCNSRYLPRGPTAHWDASCLCMSYHLFADTFIMCVYP